MDVIIPTAESLIHHHFGTNEPVFLEKLKDHGPNMHLGMKRPRVWTSSVLDHQL